MASFLQLAVQVLLFSIMSHSLQFMFPNLLGEIRDLLIQLFFALAESGQLALKDFRVFVLLCQIATLMALGIFYHPMLWALRIHPGASKVAGFGLSLENYCSPFSGPRLAYKPPVLDPKTSAQRLAPQEPLSKAGVHPGPECTLPASLA